MRISTWRWLGLLLVLLVVISVAAACGKSTTYTPTSTPTSTPTQTTPYTVNVSTKASLGNYLVDSNGMTLYFYNKDNFNKSNVPESLIATWPIFYVASISVPSPALDPSDFATITRSDGQSQTTYYGWPLYHYINDKAASETNGQGLGGVWFVVTPDLPGASTPTPTGSPTPTPTATATPTATPTSTATATPTPSPTASPTPTATSTPTPTTQSVTVNISAKNIAFSTNKITVPAGAHVSIVFNNQDNGIPHNVSVYTDSSAQTSLFIGQIITGPATMTYTFTAPTQPGTYFFRCDVHPTQMTGQFIVQ